MLEKRFFFKPVYQRAAADVQLRWPRLSFSLTSMKETPEFDLALARYSYGTVSPELLIKAACATLARDIVTPSLAELVTLNGQNQTRVRTLFEQACSELGRSLPKEEEAFWKIVNYFLCGIAHEELQPRTAMLDLLAEISHDERQYESEELWGAIGASYAIDDIESRPTEVSYGDLICIDAVTALQAAIRKYAEEWCLKQRS